jgi:hypothetical protein
MLWTRNSKIVTKQNLFLGFALIWVLALFCLSPASAVCGGQGSCLAFNGGILPLSVSWTNVLVLFSLLILGSIVLPGGPIINSNNSYSVFCNRTSRHSGTPLYLSHQVFRL